MEKENLVLDKTLFDFVSPEANKDPSAALMLHTSPPPEKMHHLPTPDSEEPSFYVAWKNEQRKKYGEDWNPVPVCPVPEPEHDHLADFEEWLATTDSIEFTG